MTSATIGAPRRIGLRAKLLAVLVALVVSAGLCELMARAAFTAPPLPGREPAVLYRIEPGVGFIHAPSQQGWIDDGFVTINALGLRGETPAVPKPAGLVRVLAVGDSTTFGWGVNDNETYVVQLQARLRAARPGLPVDVVNGGVSGYDLERDKRLFQHFEPTLKPDVVLIGLLWNDLPYEAISPDGVAQPGQSASPAAIGEAGNAEAGSAAASGRPFRIGNQAPTGLNRLLRQSRLLFVLRHAWLAALAPTAAANNQVRWEMALLTGQRSRAIDDAWGTLERTFEDIAAFGKANGVDVGVMVLPIRAQVEQSYPQAEFQTRARAIAERLGLFVVDPLPRFMAEKDRGRLFIPYDRMHFSARGNALLADAAFEALARRPALTGSHNDESGGQ
ncbi:MAG: GDSL-type esterase/lipase family protein [Vicinamibacterales bacterium]